MPPLPGPSLPSVAVIVPFRGCLQQLRTCAEALRRQTYPKALYQVWIVDNHPRATVDPSEFSPFHVLHCPEPGSYRARNRGVKASTGDLLAFTDADCRPHPLWLERAAAHWVRTPLCAGVGGSIELEFQGTEPNSVEAYEWCVALRQRDYVTREHFAATANLVTSREFFERVGPFREDLLSGGDVEWGQRASTGGHRLVYAPKARVAHPARNRLKDLVTRSRRVCAGQFALRREGTLRSPPGERLRIYAVGLRRLWALAPRLGPLKVGTLLALALGLRAVEVGERFRLRLGGAPVG